MEYTPVYPEGVAREAYEAALEKCVFGGGWLFTTLIPHKRVKWVVRILLLVWFSLFFIVMSYVIPDIVIAL